MGFYSPNFIGNYLAGCAANNPDGEVVVYGDRRVTWEDLATRTIRLGQSMIGLGVRPGDKVAFIFHNCPEFFEINFAAQMIGAVPVPVNYRFTADEVARQVAHCDAVALFYESRWASAVTGAAPRLGSVRSMVRHGDPADRELASTIDYQQLLDSGAERDPAVPTSPDDVAVIIYTGGTTGSPKGVMLSYGAHLSMFTDLLSNIISRGARLELTPGQEEAVAATFPLPGIKHLLPVLRTRPAKAIFGHPATLRAIKAAVRQVLAKPQLARLGYGYTINYMAPSFPFFHDASYQLLMLAPLVGNLCFVLPPGPTFDPAVVLETVQRERPFFMANVPTGWKRLVSHPGLDRYDLSSIKVAATGAAACPADLKRRLMERIPNLIVIDMFGQTEMTPLTAFRIDTSPSSLKDRSVGRSIVAARVVDDHGIDLPHGKTGEIWYRSATVMKGYYKDPEATRSAIPDGWLRSGDLGYLDTEGELHVVDRKNQCINTGGEKVFPLEVEQALGLSPKVEQACVIGVPDEQWGFTLRAVVELKAGKQATDEELASFLRSRLAGYKVPRSFVFVDRLPTSPVGKVQRALIKSQYGDAGPTDHKENPS